MEAPTLTSFAAPRGGCARPWGGPAGGAEASHFSYADNWIESPC